MIQCEHRGSSNPCRNEAKLFIIWWADPLSAPYCLPTCPECALRFVGLYSDHKGSGIGKWEWRSRDEYVVASVMER